MAKPLVVFGASGGLGRHVVKTALDAGHPVRAHLRTPSKLGLDHERLSVITGDLSDVSSIREAIDGAAAVLSCVGYSTGSDPATYGQGLEHIVDAMSDLGVQRLVSISGAGLELEGDVSSLGRWVITTLLKVFGRNVLAGKAAEWAAIRDSSVDWTLVRVPRMVDKPGAGSVAVDLHQVSGRPMISYADVAEWMVRQVDDPTFVGSAPFVSGA